MSSQVRTVTATTSYAALADLPCQQVSILNGTGADLLIRMASETDAGEEITIGDGLSVVLACNNANNIQIKAAIEAAGVQYVAS